MKNLLSRLSQARTVMRDRDRPKAGREDVEREAADELSRATGRSGGPSSSEVPEVPTETTAGNGRAYEQDLASEPDAEWMAPDDSEAEPAAEIEAPAAAPRTARSRADTTTRKAPARGRATGATGGARKPATGKAATGSTSRKGTTSRKAAATPTKPRRPAAKSSTRKRQG